MAEDEDVVAFAFACRYAGVGGWMPFAYLLAYSCLFYAGGTTLGVR